MKLLLLMSLMSNLVWSQQDQPQVAKFETLKAETVLSSHVNGQFCISKVSPTALYYTIGNDRGLRQYICEVDFEGRERSSGKTIFGQRIVSYRTSPVIIKRNKLKKQKEYFSKLEDSEQMMAYVAIPNTVYNKLPHVSEDSEEKTISHLKYALIPSDISLATAMRAACYVALLETMDNSCSTSELNAIRKDVEMKLREITSQDENIIYVDNE